ncbi:MAG: DEAD/DEAH box helicase family protein [Proteobacteria bacterium]|nr:DEAD/DEAH box helicase family protein [Pseudomonadota bacterium]
MALKLNLSEHTLDINEKRCDFSRFDFGEIAEYVKELTGTRNYQFDAIKKTLVYLWGGRFKDLDQLARENFRKKHAIQERFLTEENFLHHLPLPDRLSGVIHMATGTGKSYVIFAIAYLSVVMKLVKRVLVLGPSSTIIEEGLRDKFKKLMEEPRFINKLPLKYRNVPVSLINETMPAEDCTIMIENLNAVFNKDRNAIGDTLFSQTDDVLVLSDEVHHAYTHLKFTETDLLLEKEDGRGETLFERLWMKFLREEKKIARHIGFTGTPYNQDEYFTDIIYNYSIPDALNDRFIKRINPIIHTESDEKINRLTQDQAFQVIHKTHLDNRERYAYRDGNGRRMVKPITIFIAPRQGIAQKKSEEFIRFLAQEIKKVSDDKTLPEAHYESLAREKVICVISRLAETEYKKKLDAIESIDEPAEFIFAVNKLSEGWDVDNVFQIVPMQEKVFDSKLLISQVLGRGLRIPRQVPAGKILGNYPVVTVTNHEKFADHIRELVDSVTQCDVYLSSSPLPSDAGFERAKHHFNILNFIYTPVSRLEEKPPGQGEKESSALSLKPQEEGLNYRVTYLVTGEKRFQLSKEFLTIDEVAVNQYSRFKNRVFEKNYFDFGSHIVEERIPDYEDIKGVITRVMEDAKIKGERLSQENARLIDLYFSQFLTTGKKKPRRASIAGELQFVPTAGMDKTSIRASEVEKDTVIFISADYEDELSKENLFVLSYIKSLRGTGGKQKEGQLQLFEEEYDAFIKKHDDRIWVFAGYKSPYIVNTSVFKTPQNIVRVSSNPEKLFVYKLIEYARYLDSWIKSRDMGFYSIEYEYFRKGKDRVRASFNPDFFIRIDVDRSVKLMKDEGLRADQLELVQDKGIHTIIKVVEIKSDDDDDETTPAKKRYAEEHFTLLNKRLADLGSGLPSGYFEKNGSYERQFYTFDLLVPSQYDSWFKKLRDGKQEEQLGE